MNLLPPLAALLLGIVAANSRAQALDVPPLPPGLHLFVQHVSLDWPNPAYPPARFGATNVVRLDT